MKSNIGLYYLRVCSYICRGEVRDGTFFNACLQLDANYFGSIPGVVNSVVCKEVGEHVSQS